MLQDTRIIFFGTSRFAVPALEKLVERGMRPVLVVTTPDAPAGRSGELTPSPVRSAARRLGLEVLQPPRLKSPEALKALADCKPEVGALAAYGKIIPKALIDVFPKGILNVHPSLLPRWRGPTPIQAAMLAGDEKTGVTVILLDEEVDHGPILARRELSITNTQLPNYETLHDELAALGADLLVETLPKWLAGEISPIPQDHDRATFSKKFSREDAKIDWSKSAEEIDRMVRALNPEPGTWAVYSESKDGKTEERKVLKILAASLLSSYPPSVSLTPGEVFEYEHRFAVKCGEGALILDRLQPEGKKPMTGAEFFRGHRGVMFQ